MHTTEINSIVVPWDYVQLCSDWHDGQSSMLYAIASTGNLTTGTVRPVYCDTDLEWYADLYSSLYSELYRLIRGLDESTDDYYTLVEFRDWAEEQAELLNSELEFEMGV